LQRLQREVEKEKSEGEREIEAGFREIKEGKTRRIMREEEKEKKCIRKNKTNREIERMREESKNGRK